MGELDNLKYEGNNVPRFIKWLWIIGPLVLMYYAWTYSWPDLQEWLKRW